MIREHTLRKEFATKEDWLEDILTNSNSKASLKSAETALRTFDIFCNEFFHDSFSSEDHEKTTHHKIKIYECKICHVRTRGINSFDKHLSFTYGTNHWQINLALKQDMRNMPCGIT
jgi:hypothetical protein